MSYIEYNTKVWKLNLIIVSKNIFKRSNFTKSGLRKKKTTDLTPGLRLIYSNTISNNQDKVYFKIGDGYWVPKELNYHMTTK